VDFKKLIRDVPDFPKKGIIFKDITPLLNHPLAFADVIEQLAVRYKDYKLNSIVAMESRGFIFGGALASRLKVGFVPIRKPGKLPWKTMKESYQLEYGQDALEIHEDSFTKGARVLVLDDVLATGGTAAAAVRLVERAGGKVVEVCFLIHLTFLNGQEKLKSTPIYSIIQF
jgi:adenine phosphoribosyltransferase